MKKIFLAFVAGFIPAVALLNGAHAQSAANTAQSTADSNVIAKNEKDVSKTNAAFNAASSNSGAADVKNINKRAIKNFSYEFSNASSVRWLTPKDGFIAYCTIDGVRNRVFYDKKGNLLHSILDYDEKKLPKDVRATVKRTYYDASIMGVNEIHIEDKVIYLVYIKDETTLKTLRICDGEMEVINSFEKAL